MHRLTQSAIRNRYDLMFMSFLVDFFHVVEDDQKALFFDGRWRIYMIYIRKTLGIRP